MRTYDQWKTTEPEDGSGHPMDCLCPDCDPDGEYQREAFESQEQLEAAVREAALRALDLG